MARSRESERSDWLFLGQDIAIMTVSMVMIIGCVFVCYRKPANAKSTERKRVNTLVLRKETT